MTVSVRITEPRGSDRRWIEGVYREYLNDLGATGSGVFPSLAEIGHRTSDLLASWFNDPSAQLITIVNENHPVGFALLQIRQPLHAGGRTSHVMAEFFIAGPLRRRGLGQAAVRLILDRFPGEWHISENLHDERAVHFWRRVVRDYTRCEYRERSSNGELHQYFETHQRRGA